MYLDSNLRDADRAPLLSNGRRKLRASDVRLLCYLALAIFDFAVLFAALWLTIGPGPTTVIGLPLHSGLIVALVYPFIAFSFGTYSHEAITSIAAACSKTAKAYVVALLLAAYPTLLQETFNENIGWALMLAFAGAGVVTGLGHIAFVQFVHRFLHERVLTRVYLIDDEEPITTLKGYTEISAKQVGLEPTLSDPEMLARIGLALAAVDRVVVQCPKERREEWSMVLKGLGVDGSILAPELAALGVQGSDVTTGAALLSVSKGPLDLRNRVLKRLLDIGICVPLIIILAIPMALVAVAIRLESPGPALFKQKRIGQHNTKFAILKFRTMYADLCDAQGQESTGRNDRRITPLGGWLRRTSIDELPQLLNVLQGQMSLVGPRPHASASRAEDMLFWEIDKRYFVRHSVKPGITGLAQVSGLRGATHQTEDLVRRLRADLEYSSNWSVWVDLAIMLRTVSVVVHKNAF